MPINPKTVLYTILPDGTVEKMIMYSGSDIHFFCTMWKRGATKLARTLGGISDILRPGSVSSQADRDTAMAELQSVESDIRSDIIQADIRSDIIQATLDDNMPSPVPAFIRHSYDYLLSLHPDDLGRIDWPMVSSSTTIIPFADLPELAIRTGAVFTQSAPGKFTVYETQQRPADYGIITEQMVTEKSIYSKVLRGIEQSDRTCMYYQYRDCVIVEQFQYRNPGNPDREQAFHTAMFHLLGNGFYDIQHWLVTDCEHILYMSDALCGIPTNARIQAWYDQANMFLDDFGRNELPHCFRRFYKDVENKLGITTSSISSYSHSQFATMMNIKDVTKDCPVFSHL